eukprot:SAG11_NODE_13177_length_666_cov_1.797178_2_plen_107_part_01
MGAGTDIWALAGRAIVKALLPEVYAVTDQLVSELRRLHPKEGGRIRSKVKAVTQALKAQPTRRRALLGGTLAPSELLLMPADDLAPPKLRQKYGAIDRRRGDQLGIG